MDIPLVIVSPVVLALSGAIAILWYRLQAVQDAERDRYDDLIHRYHAALGETNSLVAQLIDKSHVLDQLLSAKKKRSVS